MRTNTQTKKSNKKIKAMIIIWAMIIVFTGGTYVHGIIHSNGGEDAFEDPPPPEGGQSYALSSGYISIRELIINGAANFLKATRDLGDLSQEYELTDLNGVNITSLLVKVNAAIESMNTANSYYSQLETKANNTPYNQAVIDLLVAFDYRQFRKDYGLNKQIMNDVAEYLSCGDVRSCFTRLKNDAGSLINTLNTVKGSLEAGASPTIKSMWDLNQQVSNLNLFGQYLSRVFYEIK